MRIHSLHTSSTHHIGMTRYAILLMYVKSHGMYIALSIDAPACFTLPYNFVLMSPCFICREGFEAHREKASESIQLTGSQPTLLHG